MLVQSAWHILRHVGTDDPLKRWAMRIAKTRGKKIAAVALARKLAGVLWAMWRDGTVYDAGFGARESAKGLKADAQSQQLRADAMARVAKKIESRERARMTSSSRAARSKTSRVSAM
jgi:hypothetical protein